MLSSNRIIRETVLTVTNRTGDTFTLVTFTDGSYGLAKDGQPVDGHHWQNGQMKQCVEALVRLAGLEREGD
jgi:hypothetical protein